MTVKNSDTGLRSTDQARLPGAVRPGRRVGAGDERHALVGTDGGAGRPSSGAIGQAERHESDRPRRRRLRDGRRATSSASSDTTSAFSRRAIASAASTGRSGAARRTPRSVPAGKRRSAISTKVSITTEARGAFRTGTPASSATARSWACRSRSSSTRTSRPTSIFEGDNIGPLASKRVRLREVKADMIGYTCELMAKAVNQDALDMPLTAEDKERFVTFLVSEGYLDSADRAYRKNTARGPGDPNDFRALLQSGFGNRIRSVIEGTGHGADVPARRWHGPVSERRFSGSSATRSRSASRSSRFVRRTTA